MFINVFRKFLMTRKLLKQLLASYITAHHTFCWLFSLGRLRSPSVMSRRMCFKRDRDTVAKSYNPWKRIPEVTQDHLTPDILHYNSNLARKRPNFHTKEENVFLDIHTKRAALMVSPAVVALISYTGEQELNQGCGTIIEANDSVGIVVTSANLIRLPPTEEEEGLAQNSIADNLKVIVLPSDGISYEGEICVYDFHYNIVMIRFKANSQIFSAKVRYIDDSLNLNPNQSIVEETSFHLRPHSTTFKLVPGGAILIVGRYFAKPFRLMSAPGQFSLDRCEYDCKELLYATCRITRCGDGGPVVNHSGEVIGLAFYEFGFTPFIPINIALRCWEHHKTFGALRRPYMGMRATNFYATDLWIAEKIIQRFPTISKGVLVEKVDSGSAAHSAGLRLNDVIIQCGGRAVQSFLELFEMIWDNVGQPVELVVVRADHVTPLHLEMKVVDARPDELYSWPLCE